VVSSALTQRKASGEARLSFGNVKAQIKRSFVNRDGKKKFFVAAGICGLESAIGWFEKNQARAFFRVVRFLLMGVFCHQKQAFLLIAGLLLGLWAFPAVVTAQSGLVRDYISVIGPRTSYPYVAAATDRFGKRTRFKFPRIEITDTPTAFKLICGGSGSEFPDLALANREMTQIEQQTCSRRGVYNLSSLHLGYDAIALAAFQAGYEALSPQALFLALAKAVPDPKQEEKQGDNAGITRSLIDNPFRRWNQLEDSLPDQPISISVPPRASVQFDLFRQILVSGCRSIPWFSALEQSNPEEFQRQCTTLREDGPIVPFEQELEKMLAEKDFPDGRLILVPQIALERFSKDLFPISPAGIAPTIKGINGGKYPGARPLYIYIRQEQISNIPGLRQFVTEFTGETATGKRGYLREAGFVPLTEEHRSEVATLLTDIVRIQPTRRQEGAGRTGGSLQGSPRARLRDIDMGFWNRIRRSDDPELVKLYTDLMPWGLFAERAREIEKRLRARDQDKDGVPDDQDSCPDTPLEAKVNEQGCEPDQDQDGAPDKVDACPETLKGTLVGQDGCFPDRDGDGIADQDDFCSRTPANVAVDDTGCAPDRDGDGVPDHADLCPDSAQGVLVSSDGCFPDRDGDGVVDYLDQCHGTPSGANVDDRGCWVLQGLSFPAGTASLVDVDLSLLETVVTIMIANPDLRIEIQGHSDNSGPRDDNITLSQQRAEAVAAALVAKGVAENRITAKGFGPDYPLVPNDTLEARDRNRRVEIRVMHQQQP